MRYFAACLLLAISWVSNLALAYTKPAQDCKVTFSAVYLGGLDVGGVRGGAGDAEVSAGEGGLVLAGNS
jgi:hypothetical protein